MNNFYAHSSENGNELLLDHLKNTSKLCGKFCAHFNCQNIGELLGYLHDIGKYQKTFQNRISGANTPIEHSICGAIELEKLLTNPYDILIKQILQYVIAGHHSGLTDCGTDVDDISMPTLLARLKRTTEDFSAYKCEIINNLKLENLFDTKNYLNQYKLNEEKPFAMSFLTRMLYSSLCDADSLATEQFYNANIEKSHEKLNFKLLLTYLENWFNNFKDESYINNKRNKIKQNCINLSSNSKGVYSLTVPTGGGKTLSSMVFALRHLIANSQRRIIYVIPYTAIIEQTAKIFKSIFGEENVLEHHCNANIENENFENPPKYLATENWDAPIILTTNVQFFESLFSNKRGATRKLHNITNSVIVFDEAQMLPINYLMPCLRAVDILVKNFNCTALLMSATCPDFTPYLNTGTKITELNPDYLQDYKDLKRVTANFIGKKTDEELCLLIEEDKSILFVVNSRKHAKQLFTKINNKFNKYHLSTLMIPKHRNEVLKSIKQDIKLHNPCIVVSTQLIECGVDLDFDIVFRSLAGIDSIVQAGGRCNREGKNTNSTVYVFESNCDPTKGDIPIFKSIAKTICEETIANKNDIFDLSNIQRYFKSLLLYKNKETDNKDIINLFQFSIDNKKQPLLKYDFAECKNRFNYIDTKDKYDLIIPIDEECQKLISELQNPKYKFLTKKIIRQLGIYMVSIFKWEYERLLKNNTIEKVLEDSNICKLTNLKLYSNLTGLDLSQDIDLVDNYII